jgi:nitrogen-specific signal transduction histidine kinase
MENMPSNDSERKFLHDLSNPLAIVYGNAKLIHMKLEKDKSSLTIEAIFEKLDKMVTQLERVNAMLEERKQKIRNPAPTSP